VGSRIEFTCFQSLLFSYERKKISVWLIFIIIRRAMHGVSIGPKKLYVAIHQPKEERMKDARPKDERNQPAAPTVQHSDDEVTFCKKNS
jgi:hypothetical protein